MSNTRTAMRAVALLGASASLLLCPHSGRAGREKRYPPPPPPGSNSVKLIPIACAVPASIVQAQTSYNYSVVATGSTSVPIQIRCGQSTLVTMGSLSGGWPYYATAKTTSQTIPVNDVTPPLALGTTIALTTYELINGSAYFWSTMNTTVTTSGVHYMHGGVVKGDDAYAIPASLDVSDFDIRCGIQNVYATVTLEELVRGSGNVEAVNEVLVDVAAAPSYNFNARHYLESPSGHWPYLLHFHHLPRATFLIRSRHLPPGQLMADIIAYPIGGGPQASHVLVLDQ